MVGVPVIINHKNLNENNADEERVGVVNSVWYDDKDGWYWCDGIIWDETAQNLITDKDWSVSCSYDVKTANDEGGSENNIKYDMEFLDGVFTHLALVNNPRYERANIVFNSKTEFVKESKQMDINNDKWITIHPNGEENEGRPLLIKDGETPKEAIDRTYGKGKQDKSNGNNKHGFTKDKDSGYYMKDLSDGTSVYVEKKEGGQGEKEPFFLEATHFDKDGKTLSKKQYHYDSMDGMFDKIDKDFVSKDKQSDEEDKKPQKITKQMDAERIIDEHYDDDFITKEYAKEMSDLFGTQISEDDIWDAMEKSRPNRGSADYDINKMAKEIQKTAKDKKKKEKERENERKELRKQDALRYDLKSILKKHSPYADYRYDEEDKTLEVRYWGDWEGDDGSGDYDWQTPTQKTKDKLDQIKKDFKKQYGYDLEIGSGEKNWLYFNIKEKAKKARNSKEREMEIIEKLKELIFSVENEKEQDMEAKNEKVDKRKLIDEVAGIMKSAGCDDEDIRTAIGKMEKLGYDDSEKSADNEKDDDKKDDEVKNCGKKVKNEDEEDKEEVKEVKEDVKEDVENKCKNSVDNAKEDYFSKLNKIYNSASSKRESKTEYMSRADREKAAEDYFAK